MWGAAYAILELVGQLARLPGPADTQELESSIGELAKSLNDIAKATPRASAAVGGAISEGANEIAVALINGASEIAAALDRLGARSPAGMAAAGGDAAADVSRTNGVRDQEGGR